MGMVIDLGVEQEISDGDGIADTISFSFNELLNSAKESREMDGGDLFTNLELCLFVLHWECRVKTGVDVAKAMHNLMN